MGSPVGRLKRRQDFLRVAGGRRKWAAPGLVLQARKTHVEKSGECGIRVGFTATRRIGGAVERNRARRRLRAVAAAVLPERAACGHDYVVIARLGTLTRPFASLVRDLETALEKLGASRAAPARR